MKSMRQLSHKVSITLVWLLLVGAWGTPPLTSTANAETDGAQTNDQRNMSPSVSEATLSELSAGNGEFALDLYQAIRENDGNLLFSPFSISTALAMVYGGARGETEQQMASTLHFTLPQDQLHAALNALDLEFSQGRTFDLNIANSIWGQFDYPFLPEYFDLVAENYGARLESVDFVDEQRREQVRLEINSWVSERTEETIQDLVGPDILTINTKLFLASAIYFQSEWATPFLFPVIEEPFLLLNGEQVTVSMMSRRTTTPYVEGEGYQAVDLLYKQSENHDDMELAMSIFLPAEGEFETFERSLNKDRMDSIIQTLVPDDVDLTMPKFEYDARLNLNETLKEMGMPDAFDRFRADFSGMAEFSPTADRLHITDTVHQASVIVNEMGTIAAAATGVAIGIESPPSVRVVIDRPFIFVIRETRSNTILFVGRVLNPTE